MSYVDSNDVDNGFVPQQKPQRRVPASQEYEDLVVKGDIHTCTEFSFILFLFHI